MNKKLKSLLALVMSTITVAGMTTFAGCETKVAKLTGNAGEYTYNTYTSVSPSNWNELTYQDNNDTQIMSYLNSPLFEFDFKFDENGEIVTGDFEIEYSFATALNDVSETYGYPANSGMAWEIKIRNDGKWNDGTPIVAGDFVYTMQQQLDPLFKNYRADSFYNGATVIKNAEEYVKQGSYGYVSMVSADYLPEEYFALDAVTEKDGYAQYNDMDLVLNIKSGGNWGSNGLAAYYAAGYLDGAADVKAAYETLAAKADKSGYIKMTKADIATLCDCIAVLHGKANAAEYAAAAGDYAYQEWEEMAFFGKVFGEMSFDQVGISATDDTTIVLELEKSLMLKKSATELSYLAAYNMASLPLVKKDLYEQCKKAPVEGATLWTTNYHSSLETTASWGPYMLTEFQAGKMYKMEKNPYWYGWNMDKYEGQYQTTHIVCETISEYKTAWLKFQQGRLNGIGIDVSIAKDYKNSDQAYYTPSDYVGSLQLQSNEEALKNREKAGVNKTILTYPEFRKALSLGLDRDAYAKTTTTAHLAGFGLFNSMHYYDVANGKAYRESDAAKEVLCSVYGVDPDDYSDLDAAVDAITGYDLEQARKLVDAAYDKAIADGKMKETDKVVLTYGASVDNEVTRRYFNNLVKQWNTLMKGTKLEKKFSLEFNASFGTKWSDDFRDGAYDVCQGGWTGAAWDPGYFLLAYLSPDYMYSKAWDTSSETLECTLKGVDAEGKVTNNAADTFTATKTLLDWYNLLNGAFKAGVLDQEFRLDLIAALEEVILTKYYTVPVTYEFGASLISFKTDYITYEYNTFMGFGGIQYMEYNYDDAEWAAHVNSTRKNGKLNYK